MRILLSADPFLPVPPEYYGGIERIIDSLVKEYRHQGHSVALLAHPDSICKADRCFAWSGVPGKADLRKHGRDAMRAIHEFQPDVWHSFSRLAYMVPKLRSPLPKVMSYQRRTGGWPVKVAARMGRNLHFTGCSEFIASQGRAAGGSWTAVPNFIDLEQYTFVPEVADDAPLVFLSRVEEIKGPHWAIQMAKKSGRKLIIAGNRPEGAAHDAFWRNEIEPHLDGQRISYIGPVNDARKNELLGSAAALIVPIQWNEPFGIVFIEALACGTPVISCPRGALPEILEPGKHGFLIQSIEEGGEAVRRIWEMDRRACRERVESKFTASIVSNKYLMLYRDLLFRV